MKREKVLIVGMGLIGGSIALAIRQAHPEVKIIGMDTNEDSLTLALQKKAIDEKKDDFSEAVIQSDVVFLCTPVRATIEFLNKISSLNLKKPLIITDVGSTKLEISAHAEKVLPENAVYLGGHPMAGSHKSGFIAADPDLFENAYYIFTRSKSSSDEQLAFLKDLLKGTRAKFVEMDAGTHDEITGMVSHLPHIISSALVHQNEVFSEKFPETNQLAAGGFRDMTRIAASDPTMWTDIILSNRRILLHRLEEWQEEVAQVAEWLKDSDQEAIFDFFAKGREIRNRLPVFKEGAIPAFHDLFVTVPDHPGSIADVTNILAKENISLINLKIIENREGIMGTLQLTLKSKKDLALAKQMLENTRQYECYTM
ncbi:prephenate dehydrogenase [Vagococcus elongatus]|uniref:Prephenate dehydrogenase n=1 Tax=Vagococcus elongatus TaxID=180344 RepID=A0A430ASG9_9ENTE|nr:prephenate dehydrogenase [Vagococcus elongatus]RSU11001.1 prephenate dehydrogenase [Vagococcus elongatus]